MIYDFWLTKQVCAVNMIRGEKGANGGGMTSTNIEMVKGKYVNRLTD